VINRVLAIETSCDDTSVALVRHDGWVDGVVSANQDLQHAPYGGVVPEIASRNHTLTLLPLIDVLFEQTQMPWSEVGGVAVTSRPGLIGSLITGIVTAKTTAQVKNLPLVGVNHLEGHILAPFLKDKELTAPVQPTFPFLALAVSGGHTSLYLVHEFGKYEVIGSTQDDAAGEAFDKFGKMLGLGFPGGVQVDRSARGGNPNAFHFPRGMIHEENYLMSFSGLKASAQRQLEGMDQKVIDEKLSDLCASFQEAIVEVLLHKLARAVTNTGIQKVVITGGVSANSRLRAQAEVWAKKMKVDLMIPPLRYCTDNAAMIGYAGIRRLNAGEKSDFSLGPSPDSLPGDFL
jgi:N6-L-threonylcarbamoyladenine synthase